jgi:isoleucyl-tRNA synthetase
VASVDYREDIRMSDEILNRQVDAYRRIRNTCRYLLGNLADFSPADADMDPLDRFALDLVSRAHDEAQSAYAEYEFHRVFHALHKLCVSDLSAFYLDVLKDRLYASSPASPARRSAQTALWRILMMILADMAPVLSFTAEEILSHLPEALRPNLPTVFAMHAGLLSPLRLGNEERARWQSMLDVRAEITRAIEPLRKEGTIGHGLDTAVTLYAGSALTRDLLALGTDLRSLFIVSQLAVKPYADAPASAVKAQEIDDLALVVRNAAGEKCARCWIYSTELGGDAALPDLCPRCASVMREIGEAWPGLQQF